MQLENFVKARIKRRTTNACSGKYQKYGFHHPLVYVLSVRGGPLRPPEGLRSLVRLELGLE